MSTAKRKPAPEPVNEDREILLALFHPATDHKDGCLFKGNRNLPCQCGFSLIVGRYRWALRRAKEIVAAEHGGAWDARGPDEDDEPLNSEVVRATACADDLRAAGWSVAVHNDYRLAGKPHTFWLLTHPDGRWLKGEGATDSEALDQIRAQTSGQSGSRSERDA